MHSEFPFAQRFQILDVDASELEFYWSCEVVFGLVDHLLLGCLELGHAVVTDDVDAGVEKH